MRLFSDGASGVLSVDAAAGDTTLFLQSGFGALFPDPSAPDYAIVTLEDSTGNREHCRLTDRLGDQLTVERGAEGTAARAFLAGTRVELRLTASALRGFIQRTGDALDANSGSRLYLKRYLISGEAPARDDLYEGEIAVNLADKWIWMGGPGAAPGNPVEPIVLSNGPNGATTIIDTATPQSYKVGQPVYFDGASVVLAQADVLQHCATFVVKEVITDKRFVLTTNANVWGVAPGDVGLNEIVSGQVYFLSPTVPGTYLTDSSAFAAGEYRQQVAIGVTSDTLLVVARSPEKVLSHNDLLNRASSSAHPASAIDMPSGGTLAAWQGNIEAGLAGKASSSEIAAVANDLDDKYDKSGGTITGTVTISYGDLNFGQDALEIKGGGSSVGGAVLKLSRTDSTRYSAFDVGSIYLEPQYNRTAFTAKYTTDYIPSAGAIAVSRGDSDLNRINVFKVGSDVLYQINRVSVLPGELGYGETSYGVQLIANDSARHAYVNLKSLKPVGSGGGASGNVTLDMSYSGEDGVSGGGFRIQNIRRDEWSTPSQLMISHGGKGRMDFRGDGDGAIRLGNLDDELGMGLYMNTGLTQIVAWPDGADVQDSPAIAFVVQRRRKATLDIEGVFQVNINGVCLNAKNVWGQLSARELKEDIVDATPKLNDLRRVRVRNFRMKSDASHRKQIGVVAEEFAEVFPSLVFDTPERVGADGQPEGETKMVAYSVLVPILVKGLQEAADKVDALEARVAALEDKLAKLVN